MEAPWKRQLAADRSTCSRLTSRRSPVRAGHRPYSRLALRRETAAGTPDHCCLSRKGTVEHRRLLRMEGDAFLGSMFATVVALPRTVQRRLEKVSDD